MGIWTAMTALDRLCDLSAALGADRKADPQMVLFVGHSMGGLQFV